MIRKLLLLVLILVVLFVAALIAVPYFFKDQIVDYAREQFNEQLNADANFESVDLSLISSFPDLWVGIEGITIDGKAPFEGVRLAEIERLGATVNVWGLMSPENLVIKGIDINKPKFDLRILKDGQVNWDITKTSGNSDADEGSYQFQLQSIVIKDGAFRYQDDGSHMESELLGINSNSSGNYSPQSFQLNTKTDVASLSTSSGKIPYLKNAEASIKGTLDMDMANGKYLFKEASGNINELPLHFDGGASEIDGGYNIDLKVDSPAEDFKNFLSVLPNLYTKDFAAVDAEGKMKFAAEVKGPMTEKRLPGFTLDVEVQNARFKHPELPLPVENIQLDMNILNTDGQSDNTLVNIPTLNFTIDGQPMDISVLLSNPESDPAFDMKAKGKLDFAKLVKAYPLENVSSLNGLLELDMAAAGTMRALETDNYEAIQFSGMAKVNELLYNSSDLPGSLVIEKMRMDFNPQWVQLSETNGAIGSTDFSISGGLTHFLQYLLKGEALEGNLQMHSDFANLNEWMQVQDSNVKESPDDEGEWTVFQVPKDIQFELKGSADKVLYDKMEMKNVNGSILIKDEVVNFNGLQASLLDGQAFINGTYSTKSEGEPEFNFQNKLTDIDIQKAFKEFNTFKFLVPVGEFLTGKMNTNINLGGLLDGEMMPDLNSLTGKGIGTLLEGNISQLEPIKAIAKEIGIPGLKQLQQINAKTIFKVKDGKVWVEPYEVVTDDIQMVVGGYHGFDQSLDYDVNALLPSKLVGDKAKSMINSLISSAQKQGVKLSIPEFVKVKFKITGTVKNPSVAADFGDLFGDTEDMLREAAEKLVDSIKTEVKEKVEEKVDEVKNEVESQVNEKKEELEKKAEELKTEIEDKAEEKLEEVKTEVKDKVKEEVNTKVEEELKESGVVDSLKENIGGKAKGALKNMFGKKKKPE